MELVIASTLRRIAFSYWGKNKHTKENIPRPYNFIVGPKLRPLSLNYVDGGVAASYIYVCSKHEAEFIGEAER